MKNTNYLSTSKKTFNKFLWNHNLMIHPNDWYKYFAFNALFVFIIKIFFLQCNNFYPIWIFFLQCNIFQPGCWVTGTGWGCSLCRCTWCSWCCTPPSQRVRGGWWARAGWARPLLSSTPSGTDLLRLTHSDSSFPPFN